MADKRDYYEVLGVGRDADEKTIKTAYRKLAHQYHPDKNPGDKAAEDKFKEASEAYEMLSDNNKRAHYDRFGHQSGADMNDFGGFGGVNLQDVLGEVFGDFFGGGGRRRGPQRGSDLRYNLELTFEEAAFGVTKELNIPRMESCNSCSGTGAKGGTALRTCNTCRGTGEIRVSQGFFTMARACDTCGGRGKVITEKCGDCTGKGSRVVEHKVTVPIPAGVNEGTKVRLTGEGEAGKGGPRGDLYVVLSIKPHEIFTREDENVLCEVPISFAQAALGTSVEVPTLEGRQQLTIPAGTQPGESFVLRNKGIARLREKGRGDQIVRVRVEVPRSLNDEQRHLLEQFAQSSGDEVHPDKKSFWNKVKEIFG